MAFLVISTLNCGPEQREDNNSGKAGGCTTIADTEIRGARVDYWTQLDPPGGHHSQLHLKMAGNHDGYSSILFKVGANRQTCSTGSITGGGETSYLQISYNPTVFWMQMVAENNYIDYEVFGCKDGSCTTSIEKGTMVVFVNYIK